MYYDVRNIRYYLMGIGFDEVMVHPFTESDEDKAEQIRLKYCYSSSMIALREDSLTDLYKVTKVKKPQLGCFEVGRVFRVRNGKYHEKYVLSVSLADGMDDLSSIMNLLLEFVGTSQVEREFTGEKYKWRFIKDGVEVAHAMAHVLENTCKMFLFEVDLDYIIAVQKSISGRKFNGAGKEYSIDLPIAFSCIDLRNHLESIPIDVMKFENVTINEWKYNNLEKGQVWTCKMTVLFDKVSKSELKKFNSNIYKVSI
jgi:hypothetical protein